LRRLIFILRRHASNQSEGIFEAVQRSALSRFLPTVTRTAFEKCLQDFSVPAEKPADMDSISLMKELASISRNEFSSIVDESMVPDIVFHENKQHLRIISDLGKDFALGAHLLLIGNQGVGKNKITDRFLQLIKRPRQYMQLHRDTTVQALTIQTTVSEGILRYEDSALVKAVRDGQVLIIDEADKAPLHVIAILKSLLDSGFLHLSDGRRIQPADLDPLPDGKSIGKI
jgi:midasin (ATPase involved in ribosome maturation)